MLPLLLASADAAHAAAQPGIVEKFGLEWHYILVQIISFLIVLGVMYKFGIKPTIATMEERNRKIGEGKPGPVTAKLTREFRKLTPKEGTKYDV